MFDRNSAFSMEVRDPNDPEDKSPIVQMVTIGNEMLLFKETSIHRALTADTIDPEKSDLAMKSSLPPRLHTGPVDCGYWCENLLH